MQPGLVEAIRAQELEWGWSAIGVSGEEEPDRAN